ncbi:hypothetical protein [Providencia stuartii]|uniref:hypothetical protein n=1 Tax=Providencia stuartii TaxID=588 RepID=UPI003305D310
MAGTLSALMRRQPFGVIVSTGPISFCGMPLAAGIWGNKNPSLVSAERHFRPTLLVLSLPRATMPCSPSKLRNAISCAEPRKLPWSEEVDNATSPSRNRKGLRTVVLPRCHGFIRSFLSIERGHNNAFELIA